MTDLFRRPAEAAAVPKHDLHTSFIPESFPFPKAAGMSVTYGGTGASGTTGMLALEASRVSAVVLCDFCLCFHTALLHLTQAFSEGSLFLVTFAK